MRNKLLLLFIISSIIIIPSSIFSQEGDNDEQSEKIQVIEEENENKEEPKKEKKDEKRFQFGIGMHINSLSFSGMSEARDILNSIKNDNDYTYPGINEDMENNLQSLDKWMQKDILAGYIMRNQEYGIHLRILWHVLIFETDFTLLPMDYTKSERSNIMIAPMIGLRYPHFVMPYLMIGPNLNIGFETDDSGTWQDRIHYIKNSLIVRPGLILKTGVDLKADYFSIGLYYQYRMKDFNEVNYWYSEFIDGCITGTDAFWNIIGSQSRIGLTFSVYFSKPTKQGDTNE